MATPKALMLLDEARGGRRLTSKERRHVIVYLNATEPDLNNTQLAELFGVSERTIRTDYQTFRKEKAKFIRDDDVGLIIADIAMDYERQVRDIEKSKLKARLGTLTYLRHCTDALNLRMQMVKALQDLGYYPKNLGNMTVQNWNFKAIVNKDDGSVTTQHENYIEGEVVEPKQLTEGQIAGE
jgi:hypothetical protein